ncbi:unnamed protein product [Aphanomyces euteiches]|nr:hypothetical protein Ae201684P_004695 [Aphanomyces euteiches]
MSLDKLSVHFLLNPVARPPRYQPPRHGLRHLLSSMNEQQQQSPWEIESAVQELISMEFHHTLMTKPLPATHRSKCSMPDCTTAAVSKGLCVRHGGGTRCSEPGCSKRTKRFRKCYIHGGFVLCSQEGCSSKAKRFGLCWAHGGGTACNEANCTKLAVKGGLCWTHGGGSRCVVDDCRSRGYKRFGFRCEDHFNQL